MAKRWFALIGLALFAFILLNVNISKVLEALARANPLFIVFAILLVFVVTIIKGIKWKLIINAQKLNFSLMDCIKVFCIGFLLGIITPGRIGDFSRAMYLKKKGNSFFQGVSSVFIDRIIDISILLVLALFSVVIFTQLFHKNIVSIPLLAFILVVFVLLSFIAMKKSLSRIFLKPIHAFLVPEKYKSFTKDIMHSFYEGINSAKKNKPLLFGSVFLGLIAWLFSIMVALLVLLALNISQIPLIFVFVFVPIITLLEILPISVSGIGTRDAALVFFFSLFGVSAEQAIAYSLIYLFTGYLFVALLGVLFFTQNPISLKELSGEKNSQAN